MRSGFFARHVDVLLGATIGIVAAGVRFVPFIRGSGHPLGYDTGFYRRFLLEPSVSFPNAPVPGLGDDALVPRIALDVLRALHVSTDIALYGSYLLFSALVPVLLFVCLRRALGLRGAALGGLFLALSPVAYTAYWYVLYKNQLALALALGAFALMECGVLVPVFVLDALIALSHKTTALVYVAVLAALLVAVPGKRVRYGLHALVAGGLLAAVAFPELQDAARSAPVGVFIGWSEYLRLSLPFLVAILFGARVVATWKLPETLTALLVIGLAFPVFHLPFYERIFVFIDVGLAALAGVAADHLIERFMQGDANKRVISFAALCIILGSLIGSLWYQVKLQGPLVSDAEIARIGNIATVLPEDATVLTTTDEAPWFEGWTLAHVAAPGMLQDVHDYGEWQEFWAATSTSARISFLREYPRPLYISTGADYGYLGSTTCMTRIAPTLLRNDCE